MKAWRTLLGLGMCSLLAAACTVSTGTSDEDDLGLEDGDEVDYDDDASSDDDTAADDDEAGDDDTATDDDAVTDDDATTDDDAVGDDDADDDVAPVDPPDAGDDDVVDPVPTPDGTFMCMPESAEGDCEQCVQRADRCCDERAACANDPDGACEAEWAAIKSCMAERDLANNPDSDPVVVLQECMAEASPTGSDIDVSDELFELAFCIGQPYMPMEAAAPAGDAGAPAGDAGAAEAPADDLIEGDGLCTFACYGVDTLEPVDLDEGSTDVR